MEIRFLPVGEAIPQETGLAFRQELRGSGIDMDGFEPVVTQELNIEMTPTGGQATNRSTSQGWVCRDTATGLVVTLMPFSVGVQTQRYARWSETFEPILTRALAAAGEILRPSLRTRIGLRYVNRFVNPEARRPADWDAKFDKTLLGPVVSGPLVDLIKASQQVLELGWDDGVAGVVRHGAFVDPAAAHAYSYLLDLDVFDGATEPFNSDDCLQRLTRMNRKSADLFRSLLTGAHLEERGLTIEPEEGSQA